MNTGSKLWAWVVIVGILILGALSLTGNGKSEAAKRAAVAAEANTRIAQQNTDRTECIRALSNEIDHAHWYLIGLEFESIDNGTGRTQTPKIGRQIAALPLTQDVANFGGVILGKRFAKCPPAPKG